MRLEAQTPAQQPTPAAGRQLTCDAFDPRTTRAGLAERFGEPNLSDGMIPVGEGMSEPGTTIFAGTPDEAHAFWRTREGDPVLTSVTVRRTGSTWSSPDGITIGTDLRTLETLNGGAFRLMGFEWDYQGTTMSWSGGQLERRETTRCRLRLRLRPAEGAELPAGYRQVTGAREFPSSHPMMQAINPRVYEMWLEFSRF